MHRLDGATFDVITAKHGEGDAIYLHLNGAQQNSIIYIPYNLGRLPLEISICPVLGSKITM